MSFSRASKAGTPRPEKCSFFAMPSSAGFLATPLLAGCTGAGAEPLPGTAPGGPRTGSVVRGGIPTPVGDGLDAGLAD